MRSGPLARGSSILLRRPRCHPSRVLGPVARRYQLCVVPVVSLTDLYVVGYVCDGISLSCLTLQIVGALSKRGFSCGRLCEASFLYPFIRLILAIPVDAAFWSLEYRTYVPYAGRPTSRPTEARPRTTAAHDGARARARRTHTQDPF